MNEITSDKKIIYSVASALLTILLAVNFVSAFYAKIAAAVVLLIAAIAVCALIKKRSIHSLNKRQVTLLLAVTAAVYLSLVYLSGIYFGYLQSYPRLSLHTAVFYIIPTAVVIITTEIIRSILLAQRSKGVYVLAYVCFVLSDLAIGTGFTGINSINTFMDAVGLTLFPAVTANILYHYISKRYGAAPNIAYRLIISLAAYLLPIQVNVPDAITALVTMILPLGVCFFIDILFEKKQKIAQKKKSVWSYVGVGVTALFMISVVMLISCRFRFGVIIIATESMTGELNKGDAILFERYDEQPISEGDVIIFTKDNGKTNVVHRVVKAETVGGQSVYVTKGDANEDNDYGVVNESEIVGVVDLKIPYVGYPTIILREALERK